MAVQIQGSADPAYQAVADAFSANFESHGEIGASVCLTVHGETVVDLWGGTRNLETGEPWERDTVSIVFSCTKAATAPCAQRLIERGALDLDEKISAYWPTFAGDGKEDATVRMALDHSLGLPAFREPLRAGAYYDWEYMVARLETEPTWWVPGEKNGYHMVSFGGLWANSSGASRGSLWVRSFRTKSPAPWILISGLACRRKWKSV